MQYIVNISPAKTANSFIQQFLMRQKGPLAANGIYFQRNTYAENQPHFDMIRPIRQAITTGQMNKQELMVRSASYFDFAEQQGYHTVVHLITGGIMGEPLSYTPDKTLASLMTVKMLSMRMDVKVVCLIRRQDSYLESYYLQKVQGGASFSFREFLDQIDLSLVSWQDVIRVAEDVFGQENIILYPFESIYGGDIPFLKRYVSIFMNAGLLDYSNLNLPKNRSYSDIALQLALVGNGLMSPDERKGFRKYLQDNFSNATHPRARLFTPEQKNEILDMHRDGNAQLFQRYCPEFDMKELGYLPS